MVDQWGPKYLEFGVFNNIIVNVVTVVCVDYRDWICMHGVENVGHLDAFEAQFGFCVIQMTSTELQ